MKPILFSILFVTSTMAQETIALKPLYSQSLNSRVMTTLTDRFRSELVQTHKFNVINRNDRLDAIIKEQSTQLNGAFNDTTIVEIGNITGAKYLIMGSVELYNGIYALSFTMNNTSDGLIQKSVTVDYTNETDVLKYGMEYVAMNLAGTPIRYQESRKRTYHKNNNGKLVTRIISGVVGATALYMSIHYSTKANEYKELQGVSQFNSSLGYNSEDYTNEINKYETATGISLGISAVSFTVLGITFFF